MRLLVVALVAAIVGGVLVYAINGRGGSAAASDHVVGVLTRCQIGYTQYMDAQGETCNGNGLASTTRVLSKRLEVTIRTDKGTTYTVEVPASTHVAIGDPWPK